MRSRNHRCRGQALNIKYNVCLYSRLIHPACKAHVSYYIVICGLSSSTIFFTLYHKRHDAWEYVIEHKMYVSIFSTTSV